MPATLSDKRVRSAKAAALLRHPKPLARSERLNQLIRSTAVERVPINQIKPNPRNTRLHSEKQVELLARGMDEFGIHSPPVLDENNIILCGHGRVEAAKKLGVEELPIIRVTGLTASQKKALAIADNKMATLGQDNLQVLSEELALLYDPEIELGFDPGITGYPEVELDQILVKPQASARPDPADEAVPTIMGPPVTDAGYVWQCGPHRLICGNALTNETYDKLMGDERAELVFNDVPYNVPNRGHVSRRAGVREFAMAGGEKAPEEYIEFLSTATVMAKRYTRGGAVVYMCIDWRHVLEMSMATAASFGPPKNLIVWVKENAGMGSFYRSQHELIFVYVVGQGEVINNFGLGGKGRFRTNVWRCPGFNSFGRDRDDALSMHPTVKPVALVADAIRDCSRRKGIVLDAFGGSGTTMIAAQRTGRCARLIEIDPHYCDVIVRRWEAFTGKQATLVSTGQTFSELAQLHGGGLDGGR